MNTTIKMLLAFIILSLSFQAYSAHIVNSTNLRELAKSGTLSQLKTFLRLNDVNTKDLKDNSLLLYATVFQRPDFVAELLAEGAHPNIINSETKITPLIKAAWLGNYEIVKLLLEHGANPNLSGGKTASYLPILEAEKSSQIKDEETRKRIIDLLLKHGSKSLEEAKKTVLLQE